MDDLVKRIKSKSNIELLKIIEFEAEKYTPQAIMIAKEELNMRDLSNEEIDEIRNTLNNINTTKSSPLNPEIRTFINAKRNEILNIINPLTPKTYYEQVKLVSIFLGLTYFIYLSNQLGFINFFFQSGGYFDVSLIDLTIFLIILPIGIFQLWRIKKIGWKLTNFILTYVFISNIISTISEFKWWLESRNDAYEGIDSPLFDLVDEFTPQFHPIQSIFKILVILLIGLHINKQGILNIFDINDKERIRSFGIAIVITILIWGNLIMM